MSTLAESLGEIRKPWKWIAAGGAILLIWGVVAFPKMRSADIGPGTQKLRAEPVAEFYAAPPSAAHTLALPQDSVGMKAGAIAAPATPSVPGERKIIRTSSMEMVVQHPADVKDKIAAMAESWGGYLESSEGGGQNATAGTLTIRVPAARFEEARVAIRKLGLRVQSEKVDAQDVTRQYVDLDANIRNLRAEEAQYLAILKQAGTVKDMLAVTEPLSGVRGQIEQQQAEFNALSKQVETVALAISLRTEVEAPVSWLNWRPGYQLKLALHDGLESVADYAATMTGILFYLPATLLWLGTIVVAIMIGWRTVRWVGRRWFGFVGGAIESKS
jgi:Domain of unknown function (DUF4349)